MLMRRGFFKRWAVRSTAVGGTLVALCAAPSAARAQGPVPAAAPAVDNDTLRHAREQFAQALALQTGGDWAGALTLLKAVAAVKSTPQVRFNIALCEERLGRLVAALGDYELAATDAQAENAEQVGQEVDARLELLKARVPRVIVSRGQGAEAATISLDGVALGDAVLDAPLPVDPGPHVVEATGSGYKPFKESFRMAEQQSTTIQVKLEPVIADLPPPPPPPPAHRHLQTAGYIVGGAGIGSLIASGAMFYLRHNAISDLDKQCGADRLSCPDSERSTVDRGKLYTTLGDVTLIVGAAAVGAGAVLVFIGNEHDSPVGLGLAPGAAGANNGGVSLIGHF